MKPRTPLSGSEERKLSEKIAKALSLNSAEDTSVIGSPGDGGDKVEKLRRNLENSSLFSRMSYRLRRVFSPKTEEETLLAAKLREIKARILDHPAEYSDFLVRTFGPDLAGEVFEIYRTAVPLRTGMGRIFSEVDVMERIVLRFLKRLVPEAKAALSDFVSVEEIKELFYRTESKQSLVDLVDGRLKEYDASLPELGLERFVGELLPLYYLKNLVFFPFEEFFRLFGVTEEMSAAADIPNFRSAEIVPTLPYIERLYCLLHPFRRVNEVYPIHEELLKILADLHDDGTLKVSGYKDGAAWSDFLRTRSRALSSSALKVLNDVPVKELIRYYKGDPYFRLLIYPPKLRLSEFYAASLRLEAYRGFENYFIKTRREILDEMMRRLFGEKEPAAFEFYMNSNLGLVPKSSLPGFTHTKSLRALRSLIDLHYQGFIRDLVHSLNRVMTNRLRESFSLLLIHGPGLEEIGERLRAFDFSFSPESEDGKTFLRLKFAVEREFSHQTLYRIFIARKDVECNDIFKTAIFHIEGLLSGLSDIEKDPVFLRSASRRIKGIDEILHRAVEILTLAGKTLRYLSAIESEER